MEQNYDPGTCLRVTGSNIDDVLLILKPRIGQPDHQRHGLLLSTGEAVSLVLVKNNAGEAHLRRAGGVHHLDPLGAPLTKKEVSTFRHENLLRLMGKIKLNQIFLEEFQRNCRKFVRASKTLSLK